MYTVIIVESPTKAKIIQSILGSEYKCIASNGHIRELDIESLEIESLNNIDSLCSKSITNNKSNCKNNDIDSILKYKIILSL